MSSLSMVEARLPPGFRFHPKDEELVCDYLMKKITASQQHPPFLVEVDLNKSEPWEISETACVGGKDWYFYSQRDRKYATGLRTNRATVSGYWKATGKDRPVVAKGGGLVGMRKTLVFYQGRAPKGKKTDWVMHEFRLEGPLSSLANVSSSFKDDWVLCRVFHKGKEIGTNKFHSIGSISSSGSGSYQQEYDKPYSNFSCLPPLMEQPYITFDQTLNHSNENLATNNNYHFQQVPCFSIFTPDQTSQAFSQNTNIMFPNDNNNSIIEGLLLPENIATTYSISSSLSSCDNNNNKHVLKAVLDHLTKIETSNTCMKDQSPSLGERSSESFLSEVGLPTSVWNHQY
ncbi:hypothetical protein LIER_25841 [Lithospermum erythrorhizon]|uniref:NAC domain-containing protein n=1 Tax=Lithospermum erythrorhizon TaxID=34254 RepID=A0AAV3R7T7_LITER